METAREIERMFVQDVIEKKKVGRGSFSRRGKGVKHRIGGVKTAYDFMTAKEKRQLNGAVIVSNLYTSMMTLEELQRYDQDRQKEIVEKWKEIGHTVKEIQEALGVDKNGYYDLLYSLEVLPRPASWKPKSTNSKDSRGRIKPDAAAEDIISYEDLRLLPKEKQLEILDDYTERYNMKSVAEIWGKEVQRIYNMRYALRKSLEKKTSSKKNVEKHKQQVLEIEKEPKMETIAIINNSEEDSREPEQKPEKKKIIDYVEEVKQEDAQASIPERDEITGMDRLELEQLKQLVLAQSQVIQGIVESQKQQVQLAAVGGVPEVVPNEVPNEVLNEVPSVSEVPKKPAMTFNFEDEKEGFMLFQDLKRFINVLDKNPDQFKVEIKITRVEA